MGDYISKRFLQTTKRKRFTPFQIDYSLFDTLYIIAKEKPLPEKTDDNIFVLKGQRRTPNCLQEDR